MRLFRLSVREWPFVGCCAILRAFPFSVLGRLGEGSQQITHYPSEDRQRVNVFSKTINEKQDKIWYLSNQSNRRKSLIIQSPVHIPLTSWGYHRRCRKNGIRD